MYKNHSVVVFATEHYNTLGLIRSLGEAGMAPDYIATVSYTHLRAHEPLSDVVFRPVQL